MLDDLDRLTELEHWPDEALVLEVQSGNIRAFEFIVQRYQTRLFWFIRRIVRDQAIAEEILQDTFLNLYRTIERVDTAQRFSTYLHAIAKHQAISALRRMKADVPLEIADGLVDYDPIEEKLTKRDEAAQVRRAIEQLEEKYRQVIRLFYFDYLSYEEIQKETGLPLNTVRTHLRRAKEILRKDLDHA